MFGEGDGLSSYCVTIMLFMSFLSEMKHYAKDLKTTLNYYNASGVEKGGCSDASIQKFK